jgi:toxin secretion/phage lysis holin
MSMFIGKSNKQKGVINIKLKNIVSIASGAIGSLLINLIGKPTDDLIILIVLMIIDLVVGFLISAIWQKSSKTDSGKLSSSVMFKGIVKKFFTLVIVVISFQLDKLLVMNVIRHIVIIAFIVEEILSITENIAITGIKIPVIITKALDVLEKEVKSSVSSSRK